MPTTIDGTTGASQIQDGTVTEAKIAAGAVTGTKIADGAVTAAKLAVGVISTTSVLAAIAGAEAGSVGTYAFLRHTTSADYAPNATLAGSSLRYAGIAVLNGSWTGYTVSNSVPETLPLGVNDTTALSGTWRCMGVGSNVTDSSSVPRSTAAVWLRIS